MNLTYVLNFVALITAGSCALLTKGNTLNPFLCSPSDIKIFISECLVCPQKELGFVNKDFCELLFEKHPYKMTLAARLRIPELLKFEGDDGLMFLSSLSHVSNDPLYIFKAIAATNLQTGPFGRNARHVFRYLQRMERESMSNPVSITHNQRVQNQGIEKLLQLKDYDQLFESMLMSPYAVKDFFQSLDLEAGKAVMQNIFNLEDHMHLEQIQLILNDFETLNLSPKLYQHFFKLLQEDQEDQVEMINFIIISIVANVPEHLYVDHLLLHNLEFKNEFFDTIFTIAGVFGSNEDTARIYNLLKDGLDRSDAFDNAQFYSLMNLLRFGAETISSEQFNSETRAMELSHSALFQLGIAAAMGNQHQIVVGLVNSLGYEVYTNFVYYNVFATGTTRPNPNAFFIVASVLNNAGAIEENLQRSVLGHSNNLMLLYKAYDVCGFRYNPFSNTYHFIMRLKSNLMAASYPLLPVIHYAKPLNIGERNHILLTRGIEDNFFLSSEQDIESVEAIFAGLIENDEIRILLNQFTDSTPIRASVEAMKAISESDFVLGIVHEFGMKFELVDYDNQYSVLFDSGSVQNLAGLVSNFEYQLAFMHLRTVNQMRNYEATLGMNVAEIFLNLICPSLDDYTDDEDEDESAAEDFYFFYRTALLYWFNGPHRMRLREFPARHAAFIRKLAAEMDFADAKFLLDIHLKAKLKATLGIYEMHAMNGEDLEEDQ